MNKPDFIGIGFQKAGTSWVFRQLDAHPDIALPPIKELRYLLKPWHIPSGDWKNRLFSSHWHYRRYRSEFKERLMNRLSSPSRLFDRSWYTKYYLGREDDTWYASLFDENRVSGEITPSYVFMDEEKVAGLRARFPHLKIIIMLRDPVERTWSQLKMNLGKHNGRDMGAVSDEMIERRMREILDITPSYHRAISLWKAHFDDVFIGYQEDIVSRPMDFIKDVQLFLGVEDKVQSDVHQKHNVGIRAEMPDQIREVLKEHFREENSALLESVSHHYIQDWDL